MGEIPTGLGKTGALFAHRHFGVAPDILVLGKALGGAMPPLTIGRDDLDRALDIVDASLASA
jgi:4-aminobutyrate aminotransferase